MNIIDKVTYKPIGTICTSFKNRETAPVQSAFAKGTTGRVELSPEYSEGLKDLTEFSHIILIYKFHLANEYSFISKTHIGDEDHSIFAMKKADRPNYIGMSIVKLDSINDNILKISDIDILDGTPLIDIKPFIPIFDNRVNATSGWFTNEHVEKVKTISEINSQNSPEIQIETGSKTASFDDLCFDIIGTIHTPFTDKKMAPIQGIFADGSKGKVEIKTEYAEGLRDISSFSHLMLFYHFHLANDCSLVTMPFIEHNPHGIFSIRHFNRPNPIGFSVVTLESVEGNVLNIGNVDILNGTPLLDIKPFAPVYDNRFEASNGWLNSPHVDMVKGESGKHREV